MKTEIPNRNAWWAFLVVEELARLGVRQVFAAPGSRSAPLALAFAARRDFQLIVHFDERGLAFAALGAARASGRPAVLLTTSGTAVANLFPAVAEASLDHVPMIVLSADRPAELRDTGANQTIDQVKLFGGHVRWFAELPTPQESVEAAAVLTTVDQLVYRAMAAPAGPVHLNIPLREPLAPHPEPWERTTLTRGVEAWWAGLRPYTTYESPASPAASLPRLGRALARRRGGVLVAGALETSGERQAVLQLARRWGCPVLADVRSGLRSEPGVLAHSDLILTSERLAAALRPRFVVQIGGRLVSKRLQEWLQKARPEVHALIAAQPGRLDAGHVVTHRVVADPAATCRWLGAQVRPPRDAARTALWQRAEATVARALRRELGGGAALSEPWAARHLAAAMKREETWVLASSMPVRDAEMFASGGPARVVANRGASGIDGTLATAFGCASATQEPVTLLMGDLALLHDLNSMALLRGHRRPFVVVVINNNGGGIFSLLPVAAFPEHFETCFGTPHGHRFSGAARMFGWAYAAPSTAPAFLTQLARARRRRGATLIEVRTDRAENTDLHRALRARLCAQLDRLA